MLGTPRRPSESLPSGVPGVVYAANLSVRGGTPPYGYSLVSGGLPPGLSLGPDGRRVLASVLDDGSLIRRVEFSVNGGRWQEVHPVDGINDSGQESYEIAPELPSEPGPHLVVVRATDLLGNVATALLEVPARR